MERMLNIREWATLKYAKPVKEKPKKKSKRPKTYQKRVAVWCDKNQRYIGVTKND